jgi:alpha-1,6-mannosyltransferase
LIVQCSSPFIFVFVATIPSTTVVPRTFTGPVVLVFLCHVLRLLLLPILDLATDVSPLLIQCLCRGFLLLFHAQAWIRLAKSVDQSRSSSSSSSSTRLLIGPWLLIITACQFHLPFYSSRMLPNIFALVVVLHSYSFWLQGDIPWAAATLVAATTVFRCDLLLLLFPLGLSWLLQRQLFIVEALRIGILTGIACLLVTVPMDSLLWQRLVWPEGEVFYYNAILGKSSDWGTSPWYWYFGSALPRAMLLTLLLVPFSWLRIPEYIVAWEHKWRVQGYMFCRPPSQPWMSFLDTQWLPYTVPTLSFVVLYSCLGHKEMRFIFPAIPILNIAAATAMSRLYDLAFPHFSHESKDKRASWMARLMFWGGLGMIVITLIGGMLFVAVSRWNYPGGDALIHLTQHVLEKSSSRASLPPVHVHIDVAAAMSGVSLFGQRAASQSTPEIEWVFDKAGYEAVHQINIDEDNGEYYTKFTHMLSENPDISKNHFTVVHVIRGSPRLNLRQARIETEKAIYILERNDWGQVVK